MNVRTSDFLYEYSTKRAAGVMGDGHVLGNSKKRLIQGAIVNITYGVHKNLYIYIFFTPNIWSYLLWPPRNTSK